MSKEKLTPEEQQIASDALENCFKNKLQTVMDPIFSVMDWCWPATIMMLIIKSVGHFTGYYHMSGFLASIFLWAPITVALFISALFVVSVYLIGLFITWHKFFSNVLFNLKLGFLIGKNKTNDKDERGENESL